MLCTCEWNDFDGSRYLRKRDPDCSADHAVEDLDRDPSKVLRWEVSVSTTGKPVATAERGR